MHRYVLLSPFLSRQLDDWTRGSPQLHAMHYGWISHKWRIKTGWNLTKTSKETYLKKTQVYECAEILWKDERKLKTHPTSEQVWLKKTLTPFRISDILEVAVYNYQLMNETKCAYRRKRHKFPTTEVILLRDNTRPHANNLKREKLRKMQWRTLKQPSYSPELFPWDYHMLKPLKELLGCGRFSDGTAVEAFVWNQMETCPFLFYNDGINPLGEMHFEIRRLYRKIICNFLLCILY